MIANEGLTWPFTVWFAVLAVVALIGAFRATSATDRLSYVAHVVMLGAMALMPWHWFMAVPGLVWIGLFGTIALGYTMLALRRPGMAVGPSAGAHAGRFDAWYHVAMMLGMVWMVVLMAEMHATALPGSTPLALDLTGAEGHVHGAAAPSAPGTVDIPPLWDLPLWMTALTYLFVAVFVVAAVRYLAQLRAAPQGTPDGKALPARIELGLGAAIAAGMGISYFLMS